MAVSQQTVFAPRQPEYLKRMAGNFCEASRSPRHLHPAPCDGLTGIGLIVQDRPSAFPSRYSPTNPLTNHVDGKLGEARGKSKCPTIHTLASLDSLPSNIPLTPTFIPYADHPLQTSLSENEAEMLIEGQLHDPASSGGLRLRKGSEALPSNSESGGLNCGKSCLSTTDYSSPSFLKNASEPSPTKKVEPVLLFQQKVGPSPDHASAKWMSKQSLKQLHQL